MGFARVTFNQTATQSGQVFRTQLTSYQIWRREPDRIRRIVRTSSYPEPAR